MSRLSPTAQSQMLNGLPTSLFLSLHSADPGTTGASELSGGGYARQAFTRTTSAAGSAVSNTAGVTVPNAGTTAVTHTGWWDAATAGNFICGQVMASNVTAASISFAANASTESVA